MSPGTDSQQRAQAALAAGLLGSAAAPRLCAGRVERLEQNLLGCLTIEQMRVASGQIARGDGGELSAAPSRLPPMHSPHSSAALVVNSFACWLGDERALRIGGSGGFERIEFERKFPIFRGGTPPNLDLVAESGRLLVAVESKCTEYLGGHRVEFSPAYERPQAVAALAHPAWRKEYEALKQEGAARYGRLDAAQLVKHYLGLKSRVALPFTLVYLYWEPANPDTDPSYAEHRQDLRRFAERVGEGDAGFLALSYRELWREWNALDGPHWLPHHLAALRQRYDVRVAEA